MTDHVVDTVEHVQALIDVIEAAQPQPPSLFIDLEGIYLSRHGSISIMQILVPPHRKVYLIDVHVLSETAFSTAGASGQTLRNIMESDQYPKVFFDVRNDSDALHAHYHIDLKGVVDLQLLEFATRSVSGRFVKGLFKCLSEANVMGGGNKEREWREVKEAGQKLFAPEKGGRYEVFNERPLSQPLVDYCIQDVFYMPALLQKYAGRLSPGLASQVHQETVNRVVLSQSSGFNGKGQHMAVGPNFNFSGHTSHSTLQFPMDLICSEDLVIHCTLAEPAAVEPMSSENNTANNN